VTDTAPLRSRMEALVRRLQDAICDAVAGLDGGAFREDRWSHPEGGGGLSRVLEGGRVFEKAGVNTAAVRGRLPPGQLAAPGLDQVEGQDARFCAVGLSLVLHPRNPLAPTAHANYRYFELDRAWWFGGGADLTPYYLFEADAAHFHRVLKQACDRHDPAFYPTFKRQCDRYFYLPHRREHRGVGGIFFDHLNDRNPDELFAFVARCAEAFVPAYLPLVERRHGLRFGRRQRRWQLVRRGRYVEFNLAYDRGTLFGLRTGGRTESILMSLPPVACWRYAHEPAPGSEEARLLEVVRTPRDWA
jgi:coproporphyrinogen III oxidase